MGCQEGVRLVVACWWDMYLESGMWPAARKKSKKDNYESRHLGMYFVS